MDSNSSKTIECKTVLCIGLKQVDALHLEPVEMFYMVYTMYIPRAGIYMVYTKSRYIHGKISRRKDEGGSGGC